MFIRIEMAYENPDETMYLRKNHGFPDLQMQQPLYCLKKL